MRFFQDLVLISSLFVLLSSMGKKVPEPESTLSSENLIEEEEEEVIRESEPPAPVVSNREETPILNQELPYKMDLSYLAELGFHLTDKDYPAPDLSILNKEGRWIPLSSLRGKTVLLYFWKSWDISSQEMNPLIQELSQEMEGKNFKTVALNFGENPDIVKFYINDHSLMSLPYFFDPEGLSANKYGVLHLPAMFLINSQGFLVATLQGEKNWITPRSIRLLQSFSDSQ